MTTKDDKAIGTHRPHGEKQGEYQWLSAIIGNTVAD